MYNNLQLGIKVDSIYKTCDEFDVLLQQPCDFFIFADDYKKYSDSIKLLSNFLRYHNKPVYICDSICNLYNDIDFYNDNECILFIHGINRKNKSDYVIETLPKIHRLKLLHTNVVDLSTEYKDIRFINYIYKMNNGYYPSFIIDVSTFKEPYKDAIFLLNEYNNVKDKNFSLNGIVSYYHSFCNRYEYVNKYNYILPYNNFYFLTSDMKFYYNNNVIDIKNDIEYVYKTLFEVKTECESCQAKYLCEKVNVECHRAFTFYSSIIQHIVSTYG